MTTEELPATFAAMCTLLIGIDRPRAGILMLAANRDESLSRPALSPHVLVRQPHIVAGRDSLAGGTWLGVQERDFAVALLNRMTPEGAAGPWASGGEPDRSRGLLCLDALRMNGVQHALTWLADEVLTCRYAPFSLFVADRSGAHVAAWDGALLRVEELRPGWHVVTHVDVDDVFDPRTELAHTLLRQAPPRTLEELVPVLQSHDGGRAICLHADGHGTVSSSLVQLAWDGPDHARYLHAAGRPCTTPYQDVSTLLA